MLEEVIHVQLRGRHHVSFGGEIQIPVSQSFDAFIRPDYDCVVGNIVTGAGWLGCDVDAVAASVLSIEPRKSGDQWDLECASERQLQAMDTGSPLIVTRHPGRKMPGPSSAVVLVGDGQAMQWTPYFGNQSLQHSFLLVQSEGGHAAFDSYETDTEWGPARPVAVDEELWRDVPVDHSLELTLSSRHSPAPAPMRRAYVGAETEREGYLASVADGKQSLTQLSVDTWLLARTRKVNLRALTDVSGDLPRLTRASAEAWTAATEAVYMALRRERRGRAVPTSYQDLVRQAFEADLKVAEKWEERDGE